MIPDTQALSADVLAEFPSFKTVNKSDSTLMKVINAFVLTVTFGQSNTFMHAFTTTIGTTVYLPSVWPDWPASDQCELLRHERVHMRQAKKLSSFVFGFLYLIAYFPFGLAYWRAKFEMEAYAEAILARAQYGLEYDTPAYRQRVVDYFTGPAYGWMWPFSKVVGEWVDAAIAAAKASL